MADEEYLQIERVDSIVWLERCPKVSDKPHDYRAQSQADGSYVAVCLHCQKNGGTVNTSGLDIIEGVGYFRTTVNL